LYRFVVTTVVREYSLPVLKLLKLMVSLKPFGLAKQQITYGLEKLARFFGNYGYEVPDL
jgi:hypothetical protein